MAVKKNSIAVVVPKEKALDMRAIRVRAIAIGQYGRPIAELRKPGEVFLFFVRDLVKAAKGRKAGDPLRELDVVTVEDVDYNLPSWVQDANTPVTVEMDDEPVAVSDAGTTEVL